MEFINTGLDGIYKEGQGKKHNTSLQPGLRQQSRQLRDPAAHSLPPCGEVCLHPSGVLRGPTRPPRSCASKQNPGAGFLSYLEARLKQPPGRNPTSCPTCISQSLSLLACPVLSTKPVASQQWRQRKAAKPPGNRWHF